MISFQCKTHGEIKGASAIHKESALDVVAGKTRPYGAFSMIDKDAAEYICRDCLLDFVSSMPNILTKKE